MQIIVIDKENKFPKTITKEKFIDFLFTHLDEYNDPKKDIKKAIEYAFSSDEGKGGFLLVAMQDNEIVGEVVINDSGMSGYIPEHILVYIAVDEKHRGKGIGKKLIQRAIKECDGDIKLHVEYDNPALDVYEHLGFVTKYAEMRFKNKTEE